MWLKKRHREQVHAPRLAAHVSGVVALVTALCLLGDQSAGAPVADPEAGSWWREKTLTVTAAATSRPALRYRLLPPAIDRKPGNAADHYFEAAGIVEELDEALRDGVDEARRRSLEQLAEDPPHDAIEPFEPAIDLIETGARRDYCAWEKPIREEGVYIELPELGQFRIAAQAVALRARIALAEDRIDDAFHDYQTLFAFARHISDGVMLIESIVGTSIMAMALDEMEQLLQHPDAPNLYWALSTLPRPLVDARSAMEFDEYTFHWTMFGPDARDFVRGEVDQEELLDALSRMARKGGVRGVDPVWGEEEARSAALGMVLMDYPVARRWFVDRGMTEDEVEDMAKHEAVLRYHMDVFDQARDMAMKWAYLPGPERLEAPPGGEFETFIQRHPTSPVGMMIPAVGSVTRTHLRADRHMAMHRTIEALRLHAAEHGQLPGELDEIATIPVPDDPATGEPFHYTLKDDAAVVATPPDDEDPLEAGMRYTVRLDD